MNPCLPLLPALGLAGFWVLRRRHRDLARAWLWLGLAGTLLLAPALLLSDGIPSPAASLGAHVPWQGVSDPAEGNPTLRDVTFQIEPWLLFLRRELRAGRLPLWNPYQFAGAPSWANGQSAPLFPLHLVFVALPLQLGFVLLPWLRFVIAGLGAWLLARQLGLGATASLATSLVFPLSGMLVSFLLFPMGNALALAPWVLWAVESLADGTSGIVPLALASGLQALGGHPETVIHTGLLSVIYLAVRGFADRPVLAEKLRRSARFLGGWGLGMALGAVHWLPLVAHLAQSSKWAEARLAASLPWADAGTLLLRWVLPQMFGHPAHGTWWGPFNYSATAVYLGALALPLMAAGLGALDRRWTAVVAMTGVSLLVAYHLPGIHDLVVRLPLLGRVAQHRLIFGVELGGALLVGRGIDRWRSGSGGRAAWVGAGLVGVMLVAAWALYRDVWQAHGLTAGQLGRTSWVAALTGIFLASLALRSAQRQRWAWLLPVLLVGDLLVAHGGINPALSLARLYPRTGVVEYLLAHGAPETRGSPDRVVGLGEALRPNAAMVYGLYDLRGDDPVKASRYEVLYRHLAEGSAVYFRPITHWDQRLLDELAVRWVVGPPGSEPRRKQWRRVYDGPDARLWERPGARPLVRWKTAAALSTLAPPPRVTERHPGSWTVDLDPAEPSGRTASVPRTLVVAEIWDPGWRVWIDQRESVVEPTAGDPAREGWLQVSVPAGACRVELRYVAPGLWAGAVGSLGASVLLLALGLGPAVRRGSAIIRPAWLG